MVRKSAKADADLSLQEPTAFGELTANAQAGQSVWAGDPRYGEHAARGGGQTAAARSPTPMPTCRRRCSRTRSSRDSTPRVPLSMPATPPAWRRSTRRRSPTGRPASTPPTRRVIVERPIDREACSRPNRQRFLFPARRGTARQFFSSMLMAMGGGMMTGGLGKGFQAGAAVDANARSIVKFASPKVARPDDVGLGAAPLRSAPGTCGCR